MVVGVVALIEGTLLNIAFDQLEKSPAYNSSQAQYDDVEPQSPENAPGFVR